MPPMSTQQSTKDGKEKGFIQRLPQAGSNANDGKKTCVTMGNIWELCLTSLDYHDQLNKAFSDH
jgi:hypothetical protein